MRCPRDVAIVGFAQTVHRRTSENLSETEMLLPVLREVLDRTGLAPGQAGFTCSGSSDYLAGRPFSFTLALDGVGAWPPIAESHVEMDGAWALYEAWVELLTGATDTALVYACGKSSAGDLDAVLTRQLDPYCTAPLWPGPTDLAALQAQALIDAGATDETELAAVAARNRAAARDNPYAQLRGRVPMGPRRAGPLRTGDCPPVSDGAAAVVLAAGDTPRRMCERPAWI
ncbi:lipid-transfer protein, partial [Streptomyces sp. UNOC14_S4]|nr:lipid-transfer protein [Streptomyces sp. UNOC14_S4]